MVVTLACIIFAFIYEITEIFVCSVARKIASTYIALLYVLYSFFFKKKKKKNEAYFFSDKKKSKQKQFIYLLLFLFSLY